MSSIELVGKYKSNFEDLTIFMCNKNGAFWMILDDFGENYEKREKEAQKCRNRLNFPKKVNCSTHIFQIITQPWQD